MNGTCDNATAHCAMSQLLNCELSARRVQYVYIVLFGFMNLCRNRFDNAD